MPSNSVADSIHTKTRCSRLSSTQVQFREKTAIFRFWAPLWGLRSTYAVHLRVIGKCVVELLVVTTELFSLHVTAEALGRNIYWKSAFLLQLGQFGQKISVQEVVSQQPLFLSEN